MESKQHTSEKQIREEIKKIRAEINEKEIKETVAKLNKIKAGTLRR